MKVTRPDGSFAGSAYQDNCTTGTDEVGRQRRVCSDALGQTIEVDEQSAGSPSLPAQGVLTISGALVTANIAAKGSFTITGTEQSAVSATPGSGTVTVGGNEVSKSLLSHSATPATGSVTINGTEGSTTIDPCADQGFGKSCPKTVYDVGKVTVTINGVPATVSYGQGSSGTTITSALVTAFGTNSTFVVSSSGNVLNVKAQTAGTAGNAITLSSSTQGSDFSGSVSGPTLANGTDDAYTLVYDTGNVGASVNGLSKSVTYDQNSNGTTIASALASAFNADSTSSVTASASTNIVTFTTKATGTGTNYPLSATSSMTSTNFSTPSFTPTTSGTTLTAGQNATTFDAGSVSVTVNGTSYNTSYSSSTDNAGSLAASLASQINASSTRVVDASASGGTMSLTAHTAGSAGNAITIAASWQHTSSTTFPNSSFTDSASGTNLTGGADSSTDSGTLTATVGSLTTASVPYGTANNATSAQVASALAKVLGVSGSPVVVNGVSGSTIGLVYKTVGTAGNGLAVVVTPTSSQPAIYPNGTFGSLTSLSGGATATSGSLSTPYVTKYVYDTLGRMRCLEQHGDAATGTGCSADPTLDASSPWRIRRFDYDSLSRRTSETTPESGKTCYGTYDANHQCVPAYDDDSRLLTKTDARGVVTQFTYDDLNRLLGATYSDGSLANSFRYDYSTFNGITIENPIGRAVAATTANGMIAQMTSYDVIGRVKAVYQCTPAFSTCQASTATYDAIGDPLTVTYPNGFTMRYTYDIAGRVLAASDSNGNNYAQGAVYAPFGGQQQLTMPNFFFSNVFNNRLQEASSYAGNGGALVLFNKQYNFDATGHNAGDLLSIVNLKDQSRNQSFSYDGLDRLIQASEGSRWSNVYVIDAWNNLRQKVGMTSTSENIAATVDVRNRLTSYQANGATMNFVYDEDGDVRSDGRLGYSYDAANWLRAAGATTYSYDANGRRVSKTGGPNYWYGPSGQLLAESDAAGNWTNFVYFGERRLARKDTNGAVRYFVNDYSLTTNVFADANGTILEERDVFPWGATVTGVGQSGSNNKFWFAGQEQDDESGLSNFGARYYSPLIGRFLSVDPIKAPPDRLFSPYRLNLYAYARNNPTGFVDLDGREDRPGDQAIVDNLLQLHEMCNRIQSESGSSDFAIAQTKASAMGLWNQFKAIYHRSTPPSIEFQRYVASKTDELLAPGERNGEIVMALLRSIGEFIDEVGAALDLAELSKTKTDEPDWAQPNFIFANTYMAFFMRQWNAEHHDQYGWVEPHKPPMPAFSNAALGVPMVARGLESIMYGVAALVGLPSSVPAVNVWDRNHSAQGGSFGGGCGGACGGGSYAKEVDKTKGN